MIIRVPSDAAAELCRFETKHVDGHALPFGQIDVLRFTSAELRQRFGIEIAETDVLTAFELAHALGGRGITAKVRNDRVARVVQQRELVPCFVAYQQLPGAGNLPFMTDGPSGRWSLFFDTDGRMTLVERDGHQFHVTFQEELLHEKPQPTPTASKAKGFLLAGLRSAKKVLARSST
jgi:hypothetical protein